MTNVTDVTDVTDEELKVTSEILPLFQNDPNAKPCIDEKNVISKLTFNLPRSSMGEGELKKDEDGDYVLKRKGTEETDEVTIYLEHSVSTGIRLVGLQIWRAALLLGDFIIHHRDLVRCKAVLELGSGVGLTSIVAGMFAKKVICTDVDVGNILRLIGSNVERNKQMLKADFRVLALDFCAREWSVEVRKELEEVNVVLAADVIYDNDLTQAFVETITKILSVNPKKELYLALEKRYVFTISDLDSVAPCYEHLITCLKSAQSKPPFSRWTVTQLPLDFPQYFNYDRVNQLIMYKITT